MVSNSPCHPHLDSSQQTLTPNTLGLPGPEPDGTVELAQGNPGSEGSRHWLLAVLHAA